MKNRHGQALIIVVIIIAVIMAVFANSLTTRLRYHAQEETEIYQREQALYVAEMGINQMIFNINNGTPYNEGDSISPQSPIPLDDNKTGTYITTYHESDDLGFGGNASIDSTGKVEDVTGTVGEISRKVFVSVQSECWPVDAFQYCLFTSSGGNHGVSYFSNTVHGDVYNYNKTETNIPYPDMMRYKATADDVLVDSTNIDVNEYVNRLVYVDMENPDATLTVDFSNVSDDVYMSLVTNATSVIVTGLNNKQWYPKEYPSKYPLVVHTGKEGFSFGSSSTGGFIQLYGFMYTNGCFVLPSNPETARNIIYGEIMEGKPNNSLGGSSTYIYYDYDFAGVYRPYYFEVIALPGTFREEY